jgi:hypothetical protein
VHRWTKKGWKVLLSTVGSGGAECAKKQHPNTSIAMPGILEQSTSERTTASTTKLCNLKYDGFHGRLQEK